MNVLEAIADVIAFHQRIADSGDDLIDYDVPYDKSAWEEAKRRHPDKPQMHDAGPALRVCGEYGVDARPDLFPVSAEYYRIIDAKNSSEASPDTTGFLSESV